MNLEEHCTESIRLFGQAFEEVHVWLDEFAGSKQFGMRHRKARHHQAGVIEAGRKFGPHAMKAAQAHIISDLKQEGWNENHPFPQNMKDYERMGLF